MSAGGFSDFLELELLDHVFGGAAYSAPATLYTSLFTAAPTDVGGGTEVAGDAYARVALTNNATNYPAAAAGAKANGVPITFPQATGDGWGECVAFGKHDAASAGNLLAWGWLRDATPLDAPGTGQATGDTITSYAHGLSNGDRVVLSVPPGGTIPGALAVNTIYWVVGVATDTFQLSATQGGAAINISSNGEVIAHRIKPVTVNAGDTPSFATGELDITLD